MAAVVIASTYAVGHPQADGRHYVTETHTDSSGGVYVIDYLAAIGADYDEICRARAAAIDEHLEASVDSENLDVEQSANNQVNG